MIAVWSELNTELSGYRGENTGFNTGDSGLNATLPVTLESYLYVLVSYLLCNDGTSITGIDKD